MVSLLVKSTAMHTTTANILSRPTINHGIFAKSRESSVEFTAFQKEYQEVGARKERSMCLHTVKEPRQSAICNT